MIGKFGITLVFLLILQIFSLSIVNGEMEDVPSKMEHDPTKDFSELLKDEDQSKFFTNSLSKDFIQNFEKQAKLEPSDNNIIILPGTTVKLKGSPTKEYSTILIEGNLIISGTGDSSLRAQKIIISPTGSLTIGNKENPIHDNKKVEIVFVKNKEGEVGIFVFGSLKIFGKEIHPSFVGLKSSTKIGDKRLIVNEELKNWEIGNTVVLTSPGIHKCNEIGEITKIDYPYLFLKNPLECVHRLISDKDNTIIPYVALLSRNVRISSEDMDNKGTVTFFHGSTGYVQYAQFDKLGPKNVLARYPIHFHHMKDTSRGIEVIGNSITYSDNRWVTIHDSNGILVKNNVGYYSVGHGFFLEDGTEFDNVFEKNIGIITKPEKLRPETGSSVFWTMNPMNVYRDNVAVNGKYWGFFFAIPDIEVDLPNSDKQINLRSLPSLEFDGNTAYNFGGGGMKIKRITIQDDEIDSSQIIISNFHVMNSKEVGNGQTGIVISGSDVLISDSFLVNNNIGISLNGGRNKVIDTVVKMENNFKPDTEISGIIINGGNNIIENSEIKGYFSKNNNHASDISINNNPRQKQVISAKIINTALLDPLPIYFGKPANENSFLEIYGYNAPTARIDKVPQNFMLIPIGTDVIENRGEYNNQDFDAMIKILPKTKSESQIENFEKTKTDLIKIFKNNANGWKNNKLTDVQFLDEIEILFVSRIIEIQGVKQNSFEEVYVIIPNWVKKLVEFWTVDNISDEEFLNAITFVIESQIEGSKSYN